jgi:hypothetical protein
MIEKYHELSLFGNQFFDEMLRMNKKRQLIDELLLQEIE